MRKKYLSALLFGALLFASAGTFTSCKDYDDDINNLQEQINTIASSLEDLKTKVESMGGVKDVTFADGVLTVTTDAGNATYNIPDKVGITKVELTNGVLYVDGVEVGKAQTVEVKNGILYIDGEAQELNVNFDSNVIGLKNNDAGTYSLTVNNETIQLPIAFANVKISLQNANEYDDNGNETIFVFTEYNGGKQATGLHGFGDQKYGIHWAIASKDFEWDGPKGAPKANEMVVGQITAAEVSVRPINFDFKNADLKLVPSVGEAAAVKVIAHPSQDNGPLNTGSRSASVTYDKVKQGDYVLTLEFDKDKKAEDMIHDFATSDNNANIKYALSVNGVIVTDYQFVIDTQLKADAQPSCPDFKPKLFAIGGITNRWSMPTGTHQMSYLDGRIYDMKVEIDDSSKSDANVYGVVINEDGTIKAGDNAAGRTFKLKVTLIDVNGNKSKTSVIEVTFAKAEAGQVVTLDASTYKVFPNSNSFVINLGNVFVDLDDKDAITLKSDDKITWAIENNDKEFVAQGQFSYDANGKEIYILNKNVCDIQYYKDEACTQDVNLDDQTNGEDVKSIRYAKITIKQPNSKATVGEHLLSISLYRDNGIYGDYDNAVRETITKVNIPVHVQLPEWDELFQTTSAWKDGVFVTRLINVNPTTMNAEISMNAFTAEKTDWKDEALKIGLTKLTFNDKFNGNNETPAAAAGEDMANIGTSTITLDYDELTGHTNTTHELDYNTMSATAVYQYDVYKNFKRTKDFTVNIMSIFEGAQLQYDGKVQNAVLSADDIIDGDKLKLVLNGKSVKMKDGSSLTDANAKAECIVGGTLGYGDGTISFDEVTSPTAANINSINFVQTAQTNSLVNPKAELTDKGVKISGTGIINSGEGGTYTVEFYDCMNVKTTQNVKFTK